MLFSTSLGVWCRRCQCRETFPSTFLREGERDIANTHLPWVNHYGKHQTFFPLAIVALLLNSPAAKWQSMTWKMGKRTNWGYNFDRVCNKFTTGIKYFTPEGLFSPDTPHIRTHTPQYAFLVQRRSYGLKIGKRAGLEFVCSGDLNHPSCLHNRLLLYCGKTLTWSPACLPACLADWEVWGWVCVFIEK